MSAEDIVFETWHLSLQDSDETDPSHASVSTQSPFLRLPRELRDMIYEYYAQEKEGLFYDYDNDTMRVANGQKLDPSFALSCS